MERTRPSIHLRLPSDLLDELRVTAEEQSISLNSLLVALIAGSIGWTLQNEKQPRAAGTAGAMSTTGRNPDAAGSE
jgi:hypothetical protein